MSDKNPRPEIVVMRYMVTKNAIEQEIDVLVGLIRAREHLLKIDHETGDLNQVLLRYASAVEELKELAEKNGEITDDNPVPPEHLVTLTEMSLNMTREVALVFARMPAPNAREMLGLA